MPPATTSAQALGNLQQFQASELSPQDIVKNTEQGLGLPGATQQVSGLRQAITNTTNLLNQVAPSVYGRTGGSLVTTAQAGRQIANEEAPINTTLGKENTDLTNSSSDLAGLQSKAAQQEQMIQSGQDTKLNNLENVYKDLLGSEQAAAAQRLEEQKLAEQQREFNSSAAQSAASARGGGGSSGGGRSSGGGKVTSQPTYQQRGGGGFNFQNANGQPISARLYAQLTGTNFNTLLRQMAASGDSGAADVLKHGGSSKAYGALTWD